MEQLTKVQCTCCDGKYYAYDSLVPYGIKRGEAFPSKCPLCEEGEYAVLAEEDKKSK